MHISNTGVFDAAAYVHDDEATPDTSTPWADLAVAVPLAALYALITLLTAVATAASHVGVPWMPVG